ncbi:molybdenum cofactor guanylyltransferase [Bacillus spizizenii]|uniref:Probable molybdenum cofactor guanylyltransferase n=1 Tax=Bacillus spizizenii (strain DSM 15029 / JCM 12233 / NBRC 101239 / NRRL B-23049 / TU-B-10) TaxID=1052585 RepID=G4NVP4_BACS4|nr:molybdenum cofactor guanylyltransferase [Bacillus spizizenii]SCV40687.1 Molybdopterin-guanine dinucleotide biosynthesis protein MobA [Bacillus subtilis]AEP86402.1 putative molybdopterin-guanine dinucleotide biosynthesis protein A [Bacillus spizizenii TU-B-10]MCI4167002.1 molybdenum cofactor guanylyltransferase [Bacillus spizizenii]MEC1584281.1 molybdenum cofactor guanylyltransferase [Bacillus spizizenii]MED0871138.1 molybdenum cofactor guanylyltransferase [Bacillus spizizenii]
MKHTNVLLAGGASRRFGEPKAFVNWRGKMFYEWAKKALGEHMVIISRPEFIDRFQENGEIEVYQDAEPFQGMGPLAGIYTAFKKTDGDLYTVLSCDTPLIQRRTMLELKRLMTEGIDAVVPISDGREQPLIAIYHKRIMPILYDQLSEKRLRISDLLGRISVCYVQAEEIGANPAEFINVNTRDDFRRLEEKTDSFRWD